MFDLLIAQESSSIDAVASNMNSDAFSAAIILGIVGSVIIVVTIIGCLTSTIQNIVATRMAFKMISDLAARGYSAEEVERLVYGDKTFSRKVKKMFSRAKGRLAEKLGQGPYETGYDHAGRPVPPVKQAS